MREYGFFCTNDPPGEHPLSYAHCSEESLPPWHQYQYCNINCHNQTFSNGKLELNEYPMGSDTFFYTLPVAIEVNKIN